jgi:hypothetical protein
MTGNRARGQQQTIRMAGQGDEPEMSVERLGRRVLGIDDDACDSENGPGMP